MCTFLYKSITMWDCLKIKLPGKSLCGQYKCVQNEGRFYYGFWKYGHESFGNFDKCYLLFCPVMHMHSKTFLKLSQTINIMYVNSKTQIKSSGGRESLITKSSQCIFRKFLSCYLQTQIFLCYLILLLCISNSIQ